MSFELRRKGGLGAGVDGGRTKGLTIFVREDYVLFDCPGQVELFTHHGSLRNIFWRIQKMGYRVWFSSLLVTLRLERYISLVEALLTSCAYLLARCSAVDRFLQPYFAVALHLHPATFAEGNAPDGSPTP